MKRLTKKDLERLAIGAGGTLEEDEPYRDMRVFQIVAPDGRWWHNGPQCLRIDWQRGTSDIATKYNQDQFRLAQDCLRRGHEPIPVEYAHEYAND